MWDKKTVHEVKSLNLRHGHWQGIKGSASFRELILALDTDECTSTSRIDSKPYSF